MSADNQGRGIVAVRTAVSIDEKGITKPRRPAASGSTAPARAARDLGPAGRVVRLRRADKGKTVGIAIMDHPKNYGHRPAGTSADYGLYTATPSASKISPRNASKTARTPGRRARRWSATTACCCTGRHQDRQHSPTSGGSTAIAEVHRDGEVSTARIGRLPRDGGSQPDRGFAPSPVLFVSPAAFNFTHSAAVRERFQHESTAPRLPVRRWRNSSASS